MGDVMLAYWQHAKTYYVKSGEPSAEAECIRYALKVVKRLYSHTPAASFDPLALEAVRNEMIAVGWSRRSINVR